MGSLEKPWKPPCLAPDFLDAWGTANTQERDCFVKAVQWLSSFLACTFITSTGMRNRGLAGDLGEAQSMSLNMLCQVESMLTRLDLWQNVFSVLRKCHCCKRSPVKAVVPGKWSIYLKHGRSELNIARLVGEVSLGSAEWGGLLPRQSEHTLLASETAGVARFTVRKEEYKQNVNQASPLVR